jgi:hypothetical protein
MECETRYVPEWSAFGPPRLSRTDDYQPDEHTEEVEEMGEAAGMGMHFHGESIETDADFLIESLDLNSTVDALVTLDKHILFSDSTMATTLTSSERISFINDSNALSICNSLKALPIAQYQISLNTISFPGLDGLTVSSAIFA